MLNAIYKRSIFRRKLFNLFLRAFEQNPALLGYPKFVKSVLEFYNTYFERLNL